MKQNKIHLVFEKFSPISYEAIDRASKHIFFSFYYDGKLQNNKKMSNIKFNIIEQWPRIWHITASYKQYVYTIETLFIEFNQWMRLNIKLLTYCKFFSFWSLPWLFKCLFFFKKLITHYTHADRAKRTKRPKRADNQFSLIISWILNILMM